MTANKLLMSALLTSVGITVFGVFFGTISPMLNGMVSEEVLTQIMWVAYIPFIILIIANLVILTIMFRREK